MGEVTELARTQLAAITDALRELPGVRFAVAYGSVLESDTYRDIDIGLFVDRDVHPASGDLRLATEWGVRLTRAAGTEVDVRIVNDAPVALRYNVTKGTPLIEADDDSWPDFRAHTWTVYLDMLPFFEAYYREQAG
jgi:predicted nucleotidyltransferase